MINNVLLLTRISHGNVNSRPDAYSIWDAYKEAMENLIENFYAYDYYDLYFTYGKNTFENTIESIIKSQNIQYLFIGYMAEDYTFDLNYLKRIKNKYKLCIINTSQDPETFFESRDRYYNQIADYILPYTVLPNGCLYNNYGIKTQTLYSIYNKEMFRNQELDEVIDVSFIGNVNKANRKEIFSYLEENGINIQTFGLGSKNGFITHKKMMEVINTSKINLNFTDSAHSTKFDFNTNTNFTIGTKINARIQQAKGRIIEIYLTNSFCLSQEGKGTRALFDDNRIIFKDKEDLLEKIKFYLINNDVRYKIKNELYNHSLKYDATRRFKDILPQLKYQSKKIDNLYIDKIFIINYTTYRFLYLFNFIYKKKFNLAWDELQIIFKYKKIDFKSVWYHFKMQSIYAYKRYRKIQK